MTPRPKFGSEPADPANADPDAPVPALEHEEPDPADAFMQTYWVFRLNKRDALLMLKALGGTLKDAEKDAAFELGQRLTRLRALAAEQSLRGYVKAKEMMDSPEGPQTKESSKK